MAYDWRDYHAGLTLEYFSPLEFDHPELMDPGFLRDLDRLRMAVAYPIFITDDARLEHDMERIYGFDRGRWPDSAHLYREETMRASPPGADGVVLPEYKVRAVDLKPGGALSHQEREERELLIVSKAIDFWKDGRWPRLGLEIATRHLHIDDYNWTGRRARRPAIFAGVSR